MKPFFLLISAVLLFSGCSKDEDPPAPGIPGGGGGNPFGAFSAQVNGQAFTSNSLLVAGTSNLNQPINVLAATGSTISQSDTISLVITITTPDMSSLVPGAVFESSNSALGNYAFGFYGIRTATGEVEAYSADYTPETATVTLTAIDLVNETWSATFSYIAEDSNTGQQYTIANGVFTDVSF